MDVPWLSVVALAFSAAAFVFSLSAEVRARRNGVKFEVELDEGNRGRIIVRNAGSQTVRRVHVDPSSLSHVRFPAGHNRPRRLIAGDKMEVWADAEDHDQIPHTLRVSFGWLGARAVRVPGEGRPGA